MCLQCGVSSRRVVYRLLSIFLGKAHGGSLNEASARFWHSLFTRNRLRCTHIHPRDDSGGPGFATKHLSQSTRYVISVAGPASPSSARGSTMRASLAMPLLTMTPGLPAGVMVDKIRAA